ncbi:MAG: hypothetical protein DMG65_07935 [Candidatus Angelobacter sp. Gp1-AA117]|nr:MAG: hypothetical protein DMG65_07935 [Candidatus Angelobacter sp. Gp1-AA117]
MLSRLTKLFPVAVLAFVLVFPASLVSAQEPTAPKSENSAGAVTQEQPAHASDEGGGREGKEGKEESKEEDKTAAFRHSAAVKGIARITGLDESTAYWLSVVLNFLIVFILLWFMMKKTLPGIFRNRTGTIQKRMEEARKTSEDARRRLSDVEGRLSRLDAEIAQMRSEAETAAKTEEERMMAAAEEERRRIVQSAEQEIAMAANAARRELKAYAADLAVDLAEKNIRVNQTADQVLVREFTTQLGKDGK